MASTGTQLEIRVEIPTSGQEGRSTPVASTSSSELLSSSKRSTRSTSASHQRRTSSNDTANSSNGDESRDAHGPDPEFQDTSTEKPQKASGSKNKQGAKRATKSGKQAILGTKKVNADGKLLPPENVGECRQRTEEKPSLMPSKSDKDDTTQLLQRIKQGQKELRKAKQKTTEYKKKWTSAQNSVAELKKQVDSYQKDHLKLVSKDKVEAELDTDLGNKFLGIFNETREISRVWSIPNWQEVNITEVENVFSNPSGANARPFATDRLLMAVKHEKIPPRVVLSAFINKEICAEIFERPFAHLELGLHGQDVVETEAHLERIMESAEKKSPNSRHKLRANILRAIDDGFMERSQWVESWAQQALSVAQVKRCKHITQRIFGKAGILFKDVTDEERVTRETKMLEAVENAMRLSRVLSMQYPKVQFLFLNDLTETTFSLKGTRFQLDQALHIDENDKHDRSEAQALVGQPIDMVVDPVVERYGNKNGEDYEMRNVVSRGSVWIVKNNESASQNTLTSRSAEQLSNRERGHTSERGDSTAPNKQAPRNTTLDPVEADERNQNTGNAAMASKTPYNLRHDPRPTTKKAAGARTVKGDRHNGSGHEQSTGTAKSLEPTQSRLATSEQPEGPPAHEIICLDSRDSRSASESEERADQQLQTTKKKCSDSEASSTHKNGAHSQLPTTSPDQGAKRPPHRQCKKWKNNHCPGGETGKESQSGDAEVCLEGVDDSQISHTVAPPPMLQSSSPPAPAPALDLTAESGSEQGGPDQHSRKRKLSTSEVAVQTGDAENVEDIQIVKRQASFSDCLPIPYIPDFMMLNDGAES